LQEAAGIGKVGRRPGELARSICATHHHTVGRFHRPFYDKQRPELFTRALRGAKRELDPKGMMNPGVLIDP
jgi:FAD/FMN-containing dehydrogenase